jgi:cation transport regulator ChaC
MERQVSGDRWYFAYGSNLCTARMAKRTGEIRRALPARLPDYRLAFNKRASEGGVFANIVPAKGQCVWGVIYLCGPEAIANLDRHEGVSGGHYEHRDVEVATEDGRRIRALAYLAGADFVVEGGCPSAEYLERILAGARERGLPQQYIERIERIGTP